MMEKSNAGVVHESANNASEDLLQTKGRYGHSATVLADGSSHSIYIIGGADSEGKNCRDTITVDLDTRELKSHERVESLDLTRNFHSVISFDGSLFLFGGKSNGYFNDVLKFDPKNSKWIRLETKGKPPSKRYGHSACLWGHKMVVFGGYDEDSIASNELFLFDLDDYQWESIKPVSNNEVPTARFHHTCAVYDSTMYLFGGRGADNHIWAFDLVTRSWSVVRGQGKHNNMPSPRYGHSMNLVGGDTSPMLVVFGGTNGTEEFNQMWNFNIKDKTWVNVKLPKKEIPRYYHTAVVHERTLVVFGGRNTDNLAMNDFTELPLRINFSLPMPEEIWFKIFSWLNLTALGRVSRVSKEWRRIASDGEIWKKMAEIHGAEIDYEAPVSVNYKRYLRVMRRKGLKKWNVDKAGELVQSSTYRIKIHMIGESNVGKTSYGIRATSGQLSRDPDDYIPTVLDNSDIHLQINGQPFEVNLWDSRACHEYEQLRVLSYPGTDVFFIMFSLVGPSTLKYIESYWYPEVMEFVPDSIKILVGTKEDLITDEDTLGRLADRDLKPVTKEEAMKVAQQIGAAEYITISSFTGKNVDYLLQRAVQLANERAANEYDMNMINKKRCLVM